MQAPPSSQQALNPQNHPNIQKAPDLHDDLPKVLRGPLAVVVKPLTGKIVEAIPSSSLPMSYCYRREGSLEAVL